VCVLAIERDRLRTRKDAQGYSVEQSIFYVLPLWAVGSTFLLLYLGAVESGFRVGLARRSSWKDADTGGGALVQTSLFAILGLVLAFTYAAGVGRLDARKNATLIEANALGTAFLRADLLVEPGRSELKRALYDYARTRSIAPGTAITPDQRKAFINRTLEKQKVIWPATKRAIAQENPVPLEVALMAAVNDVLDAHSVRLAAVMDQLPSAVIWLLLLVATSALSVAGYNAGIQGKMSRWRMTAFTIVLAALTVIILDFDRPNDGTIVVKQNSIDAVVADMKALLP
jgi:hypothetical protein